MNIPLPIKYYTEKFIKYVDIFGYNQELFVFGERRFKTLFGGLLSMAFFGIVVLMFFFLGSSMIDRENPDTSVSQIYNEDPSPSKVGKDNYFFLFGMQKWPYEHFYDPEIYTVNITGEDNTILKFERCTEDHLPSEKTLNDFFKTAHKSNINNLICLNQEANLTLQGTFASKKLNYRHIAISISPCQNNSYSPIVCKPQEVIDSFLQKGNFAFYSVDTIIDILKREPGQNVGFDYFIPTSISVRKEISRYLSTSYIKEDIGWIVKDTREMYYTVMDHDRESMSIITDESKEILLMNIRKAVYEKIYTRKYMKIQSVLALMGGFLNILYTLFVILSQPIAEKLYHDCVMNFIFDFELDKGKEANPEDIEKVQIPISSSKNANFVKVLPNATNEKRKKLISGGFSKVETSLHVSWAEDIQSYFSRNQKLLHKTVKRKKAIEKIQKKLDLTFMFQKFEEIEKLKMMLFNEEQYRLFEFLPKPKILSDFTVNYSPNNKNRKKGSIFEKSFHYTEIYDKKIKAKKAEESLNKMLALENPTEMDMKLISLLSPDLKAVIYEEKK